MLNKKLLKYILNVKHTIIDDVKMFDDDSIVFYVHPSKVQQCRCGIFGRNLHTMTLAEDIVYGVLQISVCNEQKSVLTPIVLNALNMVSLLLMFHGLDTNLAIPMTLNIQSLGLQ